MKILIILLLIIIPVKTFSQWSIDSTMITNKNISVKRTPKGLSLVIKVEPDKHVRNGYMDVKIVIITDTNSVSYNYLTTGHCYKDFIIISNSLENQLYFKNLLKSQKIEVHLRVETNVQWLTYYFESINFSKYYKVLMKN
jgi:hypothetical protein